MTDKTTLKSYFNTGDIPTEAQFAALIDSLPYEFNVKDYGAVGDGAADDSAAIQAAIDAASAAGGGIVFAPRGVYKCNVILKEGVYLVGDTRGAGYGYLDFLHSKFISQTQLKAAATGAVIDTPVGATLMCGVAGINISGLGAAIPGVGIHFRAVNWGVVKQVHISEFADQGILQDGGIACTFEDILIWGCLLNRTRGSRTGTIDLAGTDNYLTRVETTTSQDIEGTKTSANLYCCGIVLRGSTNMLNSVIGEISDIGIVLTGPIGYNTLTNCRTDLNYGHGFSIESKYNMITSCFAYRNSQDADNTYSGFYISADTAQGNQFGSCISSALLSDGKKQKYGFEDLAAYASPLLRNTFMSCNGIDNVTSLFGVALYLGSSPTYPSHPVIPADGDATPNVAGVTFLILTNYTGSTTITNFLGGVAGQDLYVIGGYTNSTTIQMNANIYTRTLADRVLAATSIYHFKFWYNVWYEQA